MPRNSSSVSATFELEARHPARAVLEEHDLAGDDTLVLRRTVGADGRSRAFVNDQPVSVSLLRTLGDALVEIQGQSEQRGLLDPATHRVTGAGVTVHLGPTEFRLLACLAKHLDMVVTQRQLLTEVWGPTHAADTHYLRIYMKQLRDKLEADPVRPRHFLTETGVGYRLVAP